jgi:hypothetical protein
MASEITAKELGGDRRKPRLGRRVDDGAHEPAHAGPSLTFLAQVVNQMKPDTAPRPPAYPSKQTPACGSVTNERA